MTDLHKKNISIAMKGTNNPFYGKKHSLSTKKKMSISGKGKNLGKGELSNAWKGGRVKSNERQKQKRHELGISKTYREEYKNRTKEEKQQQKKHQNQRYKALMKKGGILTIQTIQRVYEDNIKKYGTLTCYLCSKPIIFKEDSLEHKIPLSRGGTNLYENLDIAHRRCNSIKKAKTEQEFKGVLLIWEN